MKKTVSGILLMLILIGTFTLAFDIRPAFAQAETVYINSDGSISPSSAPISTVDNVTYTLTGDIRYPIYLGIVVERSDSIIDGNGHVISGDSPYDNNNGVLLEYLSDVTIENVNVFNFHWGIELFSCTNCTVSGNNATGNLVGIEAAASSNCIFVGNNLIGNGFVGMEVGDYSNNNIIISNNAEQNGFVSFVRPGNPPDGGIFIDAYSDDNTVVQNNMTGNLEGMYLGGAYETNIYHNNFLNNFEQLYSGMYGTGSATVWDDGYPSGGNFWSDYNGTDLYSGPYQNVTGSDGIGDTPYVIDANNTDNYPLMNPFSTSPFSAVISPGSTAFAFGKSQLFTSTVSGSTSAYSIQWYLNGTPVAGAVFSSWNFTPSSPGSYNICVNVTDSAGNEAESNIASVTVSDVIVTSIKADSWIYQGYTAKVNVTVSDIGDFPENVWVTLYCNITAGKSIDAYPISLNAGQSYTLLFTWDTAGVPCLNYTLTAMATIPTGSVTLSDGAIAVRLVGDVNGDGRVDMKDIAIVARAFGSTPTSPNWNPAADINGDGVVNMKDIALVARNFGQHYP